MSDYSCRWCGGFELVYPRHDEDCCPVKREHKLLCSPEGKAQLMTEYRAALKRRADARDGAGGGSNPFDQLRKLGVPIAAIVGLSDLQASKAKEAAETFLSKKGLVPFFVLIGERGIGKTVAAAFVLFSIIKKQDWNSLPTGAPRPAIWLEAKELTGIQERKDSDREWLRSLELTPCLIVDDAGDEGSSTGTQYLANLLNGRADHHRTTVVTSNLTVEGFAQRYGKAVTDRWRSSAWIPNLTGEVSRRKKPAFQPELHS